MSTRAVLEAETQDLLDDTSADRFTAPDIDGYLDEGQLEFNRRTRLWKTTFLIVTAANQETYVLQPSGSVAQVYVTAAGGTHSATDVVTFSAVPTGGTLATGTIVASGATLAGVVLTHSGSRYVATPTVSFSAGSGTATVVLNGPFGSGRPPVGPIERLFTGTEESPGAVLFRTTDGRQDVLRTTAASNWAAEASGTPTRFMQGARDYAQVRLWVTPSGAATYTAYAAGYPPTLGNGSQEPVIPPHYHYILPLYAAFKCLSRTANSHDRQASEGYKAQFDAVVAQAIEEARERSA